MDDRASRIGRNEALFRELNERIESVNRDLASISDETMHVVCECGNIKCTELVVVSMADYERIRADPALFFVKPGHDLPEVERVVEETPSYHVVRKVDADAARIARETSPRGDGS